MDQGETFFVGEAASSQLRTLRTHKPTAYLASVCSRRSKRKPKGHHGQTHFRSIQLFRREQASLERGTIFSILNSFHSIYCIKQSIRSNVSFEKICAIHPQRPSDKRFSDIGPKPPRMGPSFQSTMRFTIFAIREIP